MMNRDGRNVQDYIAGSDGAVRLRDEEDLSEEGDGDDRSVRDRVTEWNEDEKERGRWGKENGGLGLPEMTDRFFSSGRRTSSTAGSEKTRMSNAAVPDLAGSGAVVGKSLGIFGPDNPVRIACWRVMSNRCVSSRSFYFIFVSCSLYGLMA